MKRDKKGKMIFDISHPLIKKCQKGDSRAQMELYKMYYKAMYNTCLRIVQDTMEAEDIMQEAFLKAFDKIGTFKGEVSFGAWLKKIVVNHSLDYLKKRKLELTELDSNVQNQVCQNENGVDETKLQLEVDNIKQVIKEMPDGYRLVLNLKLIEGYDYEEISEILEIKESAARSQFSRARKKLVEQLKTESWTS